MARDTKAQTEKISMDEILADLVALSAAGEPEEDEFTTSQFREKWNAERGEQITMQMAHKRLERMLNVGLVTKRVPHKLAYWRKVEQVEDGNTGG
jgi:phage I-like protein